MARAPHGPTSDFPLRALVARPPRPSGVSSDHEYYAALRARLREAAGYANNRVIAQETGVHHETVRRYMTTGRPCARFLFEFCRAFSVDARWLLDGTLSPKDAPTDLAATIGPSMRAVVDQKLRLLAEQVEGLRAVCLKATPSWASKPHLSLRGSTPGSAQAQ